MPGVREMVRSARGSSKRGPLNSRASESGRPAGSTSDAATPRSGEGSRAGGSDGVGEAGIAARRGLSSGGGGENPGGGPTQAPAGGGQEEGAGARPSPGGTRTRVSQTSASLKATLGVGRKLFARDGDGFLAS